MKRTIALALLLTLITSCVPQSAARCSWGENPKTRVCNPAPKAVDIPPLMRRDTINQDGEVQGFTVLVTTHGAAGWRLKIENQTDETMSVLWDESSFVAANGVSAGRLIGGNTRKLDTAKAQPPAPLAPQSSIVEYVFAEKFLDAEEEEARLADLLTRRNADERLARAVKRNRDGYASILIGGKMFITVSGAAGKQTWRGIATGSTEEGK